MNRTGRYNGLGRREPDDEHPLVARYQAPVEMRRVERRRLERSDDEEDETVMHDAVVREEATGDLWLDEYLRRHRSGF